jgi:hypothetical protein
VQVEKPYIDIIDKLIELGFAKDADEVVRQSLLNYKNQIEFEELVLVNQAVKTEMNEIENCSSKLFKMEDVFNHYSAQS